MHTITATTPAPSPFRPSSPIAVLSIKCAQLDIIARMGGMQRTQQCTPIYVRHARSRASVAAADAAAADSR